MTRKGGEVAPEGVKEALILALLQLVEKEAEQRARHGDLRGAHKGSCLGCGLSNRSKKLQRTQGLGLQTELVLLLQRLRDRGWGGS